jgi:ferredoxin-NADP reductase
MKFETKVIESVFRTSDVLSIRFERPNGFDFIPGQFMFLTIHNEGKKLVKHFTISSCPSEKGFIEITKRLTGHEFSNALANLNINEKVEIDAPYGKFTFNGEYKKVLFLTGGIGITPIRSIICYFLENEVASDLILVYSFRDEDNIPFKEELDRYDKMAPNLKVIYTLTEPSAEWRGYTGRITADMIRELVPDYNNRFTYISGSPNMVEALLHILLEELKIPPEQIKKEQFLGY